jgi:predicted metal-dependent hydrolase
MSGDDTTKDLTLMATKFEKPVNTMQNRQKQTILNNKNLTKMTLSSNATWHLKPQLKTTSCKLELETPIVMIAPPKQNFASVHHNKNINEEPKIKSGLRF